MTEQNTTAISELQLKANNGDTQASFDLALCYGKGENVDKNTELSLDWHKKSAEQGHVIAQFSLGLYYFLGVNEKLTNLLTNKWAMSFHKGRNVESAIDLAFSQAFSKKLSAANDNLAFIWFKKAAEQNHAQSSYWLGQCYQNGWGTEENDELAFECFKKSTEQKFEEAYYDLALCYLKGKGIVKSDELAFEWLTKSSEYSDTNLDAYVFLGDLYANGHGIQKSDVLAFNCYEKAAEKNIPEALYRLACCYEFGKGVEKNIKLADEWYKKVAEQGVIDVAANDKYRLAEYYLHGKGVEKDYEIGMEWMISAIQAGHAEADKLLTNAYISLAIPSCLLGKGKDEQYYKFIFEWCTQNLYGHNSPEAHFFLGILYYSGKGIEQNNKRAFEFFEKAYDMLGDIRDSEYENALIESSIWLYLSICYAQGKGVKKDLKKANEYYPCDCRSLGEVFVEGIKCINHTSQYIKTFLILLRINLYKLGKEYDLACEFIKNIFEESNGIDKTFKDICLTSIEQEKELEIKNQEIEEKNKELNNMIAMFAHNFLGTLQCIRSNAEHDNNPKIHLKTVKMMGGALTAFSILSADDDRLIEQLKQDNTGETNLQESLANNLALAVSQLLSKTNKDKIINLYLKHLCQTQQIEKDTTSEELRTNRDYRKKWQALQHQWEDEFNALFSEKAELSALQTWIADNLFSIQITGWNEHDIRFKEYGITDSIFLVIFMEIFVNALKYMDVTGNEPFTMTLCKQDQCYKLLCENPSSKDTGKGTHKGIDFLNTIAKKLNGSFSSEFTENSFKTAFIIPSDLLK